MISGVVFQCSAPKLCLELFCYLFPGCWFRKSIILWAMIEVREIILHFEGIPVVVTIQMCFLPMFLDYLLKESLCLRLI